MIAAVDVELVAVGSRRNTGLLNADLVDPITIVVRHLGAAPTVDLSAQVHRVDAGREGAERDLDVHVAAEEDLRVLAGRVDVVEVPVPGHLDVAVSIRVRLGARDRVEPVAAALPAAVETAHVEFVRIRARREVVAREDDS